MENPLELASLRKDALLADLDVTVIEKSIICKVRFLELWQY